MYDIVLVDCKDMIVDLFHRISEDDVTLDLYAGTKYHHH